MNRKSFFIILLFCFFIACVFIGKFAMSDDDDLGGDMFDSSGSEVFDDTGGGEYVGDSGNIMQTESMGEGEYMTSSGDIIEDTGAGEDLSTSGETYRDMDD